MFTCFYTVQSTGKELNSKHSNEFIWEIDIRKQLVTFHTPSAESKYKKLQLTPDSEALRAVTTPTGSESHVHGLYREREKKRRLPYSLSLKFMPVQEFTYFWFAFLLFPLRFCFFRFTFAYTQLSFITFYWLPWIYQYPLLPSMPTVAATATATAHSERGAPSPRIRNNF